MVHHATVGQFYIKSYMTFTIQQYVLYGSCYKVYRCNIQSIECENQKPITLQNIGYTFA